MGVGQISQGAGSVDIQKQQLARKRLRGDGMVQGTRLRGLGFRLVNLSGEHQDRIRSEKRTQKMLVHETTY
mgnify:CR=1 FL=1